MRDGQRVRLQDQPFRMLVVLLERAGQVVTREEIQGRIWPENTFVDFDSSLRVALRKLRDALEDDAEQPLYVETIPKRGYRFLAPVTAIGGQAGVAVTEVPVASVSASRGRLAWTAAAAAMVVAAAFAGYFLLARRAPAALGDQDTVVLAEFTNATALYPVYVRGLAYLALNRGRDAAAEFQKILDRPGIVVSDPVAAAARTQLTRARAMTARP